MTQHEANAALCRALGVEPSMKRCILCDARTPSSHLDGCAFALDSKFTYPDLTSADALMAALEKFDDRGFQLFSHSAWVPSDAKQLRLTPRRFGETHGSMLFRAACAAFGIDLE